MYLIFDTETTGLPRNYDAPLEDLDNWPRLVQLAWQLHDGSGKLLRAGNHIVRPEGFTIPFNAEKVHGISTERALREGKELSAVLADFATDLARTETVIGHNIEFDLKIVGAEYLRTGQASALLERRAIDTKDAATDYTRIPGGMGGKFKWPTLTELHQKLFGEGFADAHDAAYDVAATARCFFGLIGVGVIAPHDGRDPAAIAYEAPDLPPANFQQARVRTGFADFEAAKQRQVERVLPFAHLHVHSQYSVLQATADVKQLVQQAKAQGMAAVAITDLGNLFGAYNAVAEGEKTGVKVIIGCEVFMVKDHTKLQFTKNDPDRRTQQVLLAKNQAGFHNLARLCSRGFTEGFYSGYPRVSRELIAEHRQDLMALTGNLYGEVPGLILNVGENQAETAFCWWLDVFGEDFYVELINHGLEEERRVNEVLLRFADKYRVKVVASNDVFYLRQADADAHDTLLCVKDSEKKNTPIGRGRGKRYGFPNQEFYFKTAEEMNALFADVPEALENVQEIVDKTTPIKLKRDILMPNFALPAGFATQDDYLRHLSYEGAQRHYGTPLSDEVTARLDLELKIIADMGFPGYFLIVQDFINAARQMGVAVGPGRGSAAGSVVAFCTGITNIDPLKYELLFERFLNPERVSMPDIDIDFDDAGREKAIQYVVDKYGRDQVAHIITYGTMAARSAIKDVARVLDLPLAEANALAKLVPEKPGTKLAGAYQSVPELGELVHEDSPRGTVLRQALVLEGLVRNVGIHAAGIIIAPDEITRYIPVCTARDAQLNITQFDGKVVEDAGMLKMDFLGLKTLSIIKMAVALIEKKHGIALDIDQIPLEDAKTFELYQRGDTVATFQFESEGMRQYLRDLQPTSMNDLIAMNALYRPGPMDFIPDYIKRKHGQQAVSYPHPLLETLLSHTQGIMVYQEQIMQTAQLMGGYTLGGADLLRRAMGKKKMDEMAKQRVIFAEGAQQKHGIDAQKADEIFDIMQKFAEYGFNKSHSAAYSVVAYQTGYLKANYPAEYMAAVLSNWLGNIEKITGFIEECKRMGVPVLGPDVNESSVAFDVNEQNEIRFGLGAVKGAGEAAVAHIIEERRAHGPFTDIFDFACRVNLKTVNKKTFESLAYAGAFDGFRGTHRAQYFHTADGDKLNLIEKATQFGQAYHAQKNAAQQSLFGFGGDSAALPTPSVPACRPWGMLEKLKHEKEVVGFYLSGHPLDQYRLDIETFCTCTLDQVDDPRYHNQDVAVAGIVTEKVIRQTKTGNPFCLFTIEDYNGSLKLALFGNDFVTLGAFVEPDYFLFLRGKVQPRFGSSDQWELRPAHIELLETVRQKMAKGIRLALDARRLDRSTMTELERVLTDHPGEARVLVELTHPEDARPVTAVAHRYRVAPSHELMSALQRVPGLRFGLER